MAIAATLDGLLRAADLPIIGVSIGRRDDKTTWRIDWHGEPTSEQLETLAAVIAALDPEAPEVPASISDRQFFQQLAVAGIISEADALAANAAVIPSALTAIIDAMPAEQQFPARMLLGGATVFERQNPYTIAIGTAYGWSSDQIDDFFRAAALL